MFLPAGSDEATTLPAGPLGETALRRALSTTLSLPFGGRSWSRSSNASPQSLLSLGGSVSKGRKQPPKTNKAAQGVASQIAL